MNAESAGMPGVGASQPETVAERYGKHCGAENSLDAEFYYGCGKKI